VAVVPGQVERQLLLESGETIWDDAQTSSAFVLDRSNPALNHSQTAVFPQSTESMPNPVAVAPPPERSRGELNPLVRDEIARDGSRLLKGSFEECAHP